MCRIVLSSVFVLEYFLDTLWKGMLLFIFCLVLVCTGTLEQVRGPAPHPTPRRNLLPALTSLLILGAHR